MALQVPPRVPRSGGATLVPESEGWRPCAGHDRGAACARVREAGSQVGGALSPPGARRSGNREGLPVARGPWDVAWQAAPGRLPGRPAPDGGGADVAPERSYHQGPKMCPRSVRVVWAAYSLKLKSCLFILVLYVW